MIVFILSVYSHVIYIDGIINIEIDYEITSVQNYIGPIVLI